MAPRKVSEISRSAQPMNWGRAFVAGMGAASLMMAFIDTYYMMGFTPFSYELYLGAMIRGSRAGIHNWTLGVFASLLVGGLFGWLYAYFFEYVFKRSNVRLGTLLGFGHLALAGVAIFPFFTAIHEQMDLNLYPQFGFLGVSLGWPTLILISTGHLLFGATVGLFYGPVRARRVRMRAWEPGESARRGDSRAITPEEDPEDRMAI